MKAILINGSPRIKNWNTITLLQEAEKGLKEIGFETEIVNLYSHLYRGCISCFLCKRKKDIQKHRCEYKDDLTPILDKSIDADVIIIGSPVYFGEPTGETRAYLERLLFPITPYMVDENGNRVSLLNKTIPTAMIYTMNCPKEVMEEVNYPTLLENSVDALKFLFGYSEVLYACDTYQFKDYSQYEANMFDEKKKIESREKNFPEDCKKARELGKKLGLMAIEKTNRVGGD